MSLLELPPELLHRICGYCEVAGIKSVRCTSNLLAAIGAEYLLSEVEVFFVRESLDRMMQIAHSPGVAKGLRTLCFQADRLPILACRSDWEGKRDRSDFERETIAATPTSVEIRTLKSTPRGERLLNRRLVKAVETERKLDVKGRISAAYHLYETLLRDESRLETDGTARESLRTLFKASPRLDSIIFTVANELRHTTTTNVDSFNATLTHPFGDRDNQTWCIHQLQATLCAAYDANLDLASLAVATISYRFFDLPPDVADQVYRVASRLRNLRIDFNWCYDNDTDEMDDTELTGLLRDVKDQRLVHFFASASQLHRLKIGGPYADRGALKLPLIDTVGDTIWPRLRTLHLEHFECTQEDLAHLMSRHARTLECVQLGEMTMKEGNWNDFFESIAGKLPVLRKVLLEGQFLCLTGSGVEFDFGDVVNGDIDPFTGLMQDYVVDGGTMPDPTTADEAWDSMTETDEVDGEEEADSEDDLF
ncbi:hypothetical protein LTR36_010095 [Oleoguttula mirabilis]|uniref:F-box domain-containing protein n=1 Tax=Oleoguttula mirabilis TaxID=1507867 RepID=A0AAV9JRW3_9PEZI|nr:hypothetical protein LTR36_010095 [Oleoguttula mirabilis]